MDSGPLPTHPLFALDLAVPAQGSRARLRELHRQLRAAIVAGRLQSGLRLPSSRAFAGHLAISRNTALAVYDLLLSEGFLTTRPGAGTFVAGQPRSGVPVAPASPPTRPDPRIALRPFESDWACHGPAPLPIEIDMRVGIPDRSLFPFDAWRRLSNRVLRTFSRGGRADLDPAGPAVFRRAIAAHVSFTRAVAAAPEDVLATTGAQQAFDLIARILVRPGETLVAVEDPGYPPVRAAFAAAGARLHPVPVDDEGIDVARIPADAAIVCVTPSHQFPTGVALSLRRRHALLEFAARTGAVVVEDDYDGEFRFGGRPLDALQTLDRHRSVFYVGTFSKSLFLALRLGFLVAPAWARPALLAARSAADRHGATLPQLVLADFIAEGHLARHVRRMSRSYGERRRLLLAALARHCGGRLRPIASEAGLHLAARLAPGLDAQAVVERAAEMGVAMDRVGRYAIGPVAQDALAFGFSGCAADAIEPGIQRVARAIALADGR
ncbi:GntR family transcriptional regulator/MocR family aminotransferase [Stella humosa]|uniref:GntR family transcriptional regulator/MocR family aminotransferase n=1 Tax=Stella humosa TaxID=94 RepID=A0A3N1KZP0_9PROT|nr:PLP-dependent aminotransferase family protein [Stella humosa]ROP83788.1 GntR family transcriptional regulator/MocR family aminotransferase [Stella humosa]BBK32951.1 GntR family transcriptional regulator [Stella humosa]